ncbi:DUF4097 family beta strand repeat-containing protein [Kitasatospora sp. NBC_00458]|uniref:DUF4097 family beta strand repeat-containing protein n=1 Tax=Kitasatospora sp. NBC_00458 TaxID=2903568 RepID=UPI002E1930A7
MPNRAREQEREKEKERRTGQEREESGGTGERTPRRRGRGGGQEPPARGYRAWRVLGLLALVVTLVVGAVQTWAMVVQQRRESEKSYPVAVTRVVLDTGSATVRIRPGQEGRVVVRQELDWMIRPPLVSVLFDRTDLRVGMRCNQVIPAAELGCGAEIELEVPVGVSVEGTGSSGSVEVTGVTGEVRLDSTSGSIRLTDLPGPVAVSTTSGSVKGTGLASASAEVRATSGSVDLSFVRPPQVVDVGATSGAVTLGLPRGSGYRFNGGIVSGSRHIDPLLADQSSTNQVRVSVTSGSVTVLSVPGATSEG